MAASGKGRRILRLGLDGGACGGKTEGAEMLKERLWKEKDVLLIVIPEIARLVFKSGVRQEEIMPLPGPKYMFERNTLSLQMSLIKHFMTYAGIQAEVCRVSGSAKLVALCSDRPAMSIASFIGMPDFRSIAGDLGYGVDEIRNSCDAVFIPVTAADGAEEHYKNRYESLKQAREHQSRIIEAWAGHPYMRVFPNVEVVGGVLRKISFEEKMDRLFGEVCIFLDV